MGMKEILSPCILESIKVAGLRRKGIEIER